MTPSRADRLLVSGEQQHRRWLLVGVAGLLLASTSPVFGHHVFPAVENWPTIEHIGVLCLKALESLFAPIHDGFHWLILAGAAYAVIDRLRAIRTLRSVVTGLSARPPRAGTPIWRAARRAGLRAERVRVGRNLPNPAFTAGWVRPRVFVSAELVEHLSFDQLAAVMAHERAHVERRDPLRLSLLRALACTLFWIPALRRLSDDLADEAEILADTFAAAHTSALALASAILILASWPDARAAAAPGFARHELIDRRVRRLVGESTQAGTRITWRSLVGAAVALALAWSSGVVALHARATDSSATMVHCEHAGAPALSHLFCLRSALLVPAQHCPHGAG